MLKNIQHFCRTCGAKLQGENACVSVVSYPTLSQWFQTNLNIEVNRTNHFPTCCCINCINFIKKWTQFKETIQKNDKAYKRIIQYEQKKVQKSEDPSSSQERIESYTLQKDYKTVGEEQKSPACEERKNTVCEEQNTAVCIEQKTTVFDEQKMPVYKEQTAFVCEEQKMPVCEEQKTFAFEEQKMTDSNVQKMPDCQEQKTSVCEEQKMFVLMVQKMPIKEEQKAFVSEDQEMPICKEQKTPVYKEQKTSVSEEQKTAVIKVQRMPNCKVQIRTVYEEPKMPVCKMQKTPICKEQEKPIAPEISDECKSRPARLRRKTEFYGVNTQKRKCGDGPSTSREEPQSEMINRSSVKTKTSQETPSKLRIILEENKSECQQMPDEPMVMITEELDIKTEPDDGIWSVESEMMQSDEAQPQLAQFEFISVDTPGVKQSHIDSVSKPSHSSLIMLPQVREGDIIRVPAILHNSIQPRQNQHCQSSFLKLLVKTK